jgi:competence protein ComEC
MRTLKSVLLLSVFAAILPAANTTEFYAIDSEGKAMLTIAPSGETMLVDLGWTGFGAQGATTNQVVQGLKTIGVKRIDHLLISHFDVDHIGDISELLAAIPVGHCYDHGEIQLPPDGGAAPGRGAAPGGPPAGAGRGPAPAGQPGAAAPGGAGRGGAGNMAESSRQSYQKYADACEKIGRTILKPGDKVPIKGLDVQVIHAAGKWITQPLPGAGQPNPACATTTQPALVPRDLEDNASIGLLYTYGKFRFYDPADLEGYYAHALVCPNNPIGTVDLWSVNVHGQGKGYSAATASALKAPVVIEFTDGRMGRGNDASVWDALHALPAVPDIWLLHANKRSGAEKNPPEDFIANIATPDEMKSLKISAEQSGTFTITNLRNGFSKTYKK